LQGPDFRAFSILSGCEEPGYMEVRTVSVQLVQHVVPGLPVEGRSGVENAGKSAACDFDDILPDLVGAL
jgi:hypothetical protein